MELGDVIYEKRTVTSIKNIVSPRYYEDDVQYKVERVNAIEIPGNATNGEVIKALFPQAEIEGSHKDIYEKPHLYRVYKLDIYPTDFTEEFWNAPYKLSDLKGE